MLNNRKTFERLMAVLRAVDPKISLPAGFEEYLWANMQVEDLCRVERMLEQEGATPRKAYFVVRGLVIVEGYVNGLPYLQSIYRENTIVGLNAFMKHEVSLQSVSGTKDTLVWSISHKCMEEIYRTWPGLRAFALQTALNYLEVKQLQRSAFQALEEKERVLGFYQVYAGLLPVRKSRLSDKRIASYLAMPVRHMRGFRTALGKEGMLYCA